LSVEKSVAMPAYVRGGTASRLCVAILLALLTHTIAFEDEPRNVQVRSLSSTTMVIQWDEPAQPKAQVMGYKMSQSVANNQLTTISDLKPHTIYTIRVQASTSVGLGPLSAPANVKTQQGAPSQPSNLRVSDIGETAVTLEWSHVNHSDENIVSYVLYWNDTYAEEKHRRRIPIVESYTLTGLFPNSLYYVWLAARSQRGDGATTSPIPVRTKQYVPGDPQDVKAVPINFTSIKVTWKPPLAKVRNGIIQGYSIQVQETKEESKSPINEAMKFYILDDIMLELNISGLQPDTKYSVQIAALTRNGDGDRSPPVSVKTPAGVPNRPSVTLKLIGREPTVKIEVEWARPTQTYGDLQGYRLRYGVKNQTLKEEILKGTHTTNYRINDLERGDEYEFRVAGQNHIGIGQEAIKYMNTPEGAPNGPPTNISYKFQTLDVVCVMWGPPNREHRNGQITRYDVQFHKKIDHSTIIERNITQTKAVFTNLEENTDYVFYVKAYTSQGGGPFSEKIAITTERDIGRAPMSLRAVATSASSVEVWWQTVPSGNKVTDYKIFYTMSPVEDLDEWQQKNVELSDSADLENLEKYAQYTIAVAAKTKNKLGRISETVTVKVKPEDVPLSLRAQDVSTHSMTLSWSPPIRLNSVGYKISYDAVKEFVDSQGITQSQIVPRREITLKPEMTSYTISELSPFTSYNVNVSAIATGEPYRPPAKITVTTQMAAPQPMSKPDFYGVLGVEEIIVTLPLASEQYGPVRHYYLIVVPEDKSTVHKNPDQFLTEEMVANKGAKAENLNAPYISAKFPSNNIPYVFHLGTDKVYDGFLNRKLERTKKYRVFVRAVVDTSQKHLYTSSPFSEFLSLDKREASTGDIS
ncbi:Leukocyte-antigen-related-like, partial [Carabus blaptoides fortunei]